MGDKITKRHQALESIRATFESHWQEIAELVYPRRADFTGPIAKGDKNMEKVYDSTPIMANELLASSLHGMLTNPSSKWFNLTVQGELGEDEEVKRYLEEVIEIMFSFINDPKAGFTNAMHEFYLEYCAFGTGIMFITESDAKDGLSFNARPLTEVYMCENADGRVDTFSRKFRMTVRQIVERWEKTASDSVKKMFKEGKFDDEFTIIHQIRPRDVFDKRKKSNDNKPIQSIYIEEAEKNTLEDTGFDELPLMAARFNKSPGEVYGRGPSMTALPDIKMVNEMQRTTIRAAQKVVDPPLLVEDDGVIGPVRTVPGGLNYFRSGTEGIKPLLTGGQIALSEQMMESVRARIREAFFINQLQLNEGPQMTATEVLQRTEESLRVLGPVLGRLQTELLGPMVDRIFGILSRAGAFPDAPAVAEGAELEVLYESPLARSQRTIETQGVLRVVEALGPFIQQDPSILQRFNGDAAFKEYADIFDVNPNLVRTDKEVEDIKQAQAQAEEQAQLVEQAKAGSEAVRNLKEVI